MTTFSANRCSSLLLLCAILGNINCNGKNITNRRCCFVLFLPGITSTANTTVLFCIAVIAISCEKLCMCSFVFDIGKEAIPILWQFKGSSRDLMALLMGASLWSLLVPAFTDSWLFPSNTHQAVAVFHACLVNGSDVDLCLQMNLHNLASKEQR